MKLLAATALLCMVVSAEAYGIVHHAPSVAPAQTEPPKPTIKAVDDQSAFGFRIEVKCPKGWSVKDGPGTHEGMSFAEAINSSISSTCEKSK